METAQKHPMKECPHCYASIPAPASVCMHCQRDVQPNQTTPPTETKTKAQTASVINFFVPGLGHIYFGQLKTGFFLFALVLWFFIYFVNFPGDVRACWYDEPSMPAYQGYLRAYGGSPSWLEKWACGGIPYEMFTNASLNTLGMVAIGGIWLYGIIAAHRFGTADDPKKLLPNRESNEK